MSAAVFGTLKMVTRQGKGGAEPQPKKGIQEFEVDLSNPAFVKRAVEAAPGILSYLRQHSEVLGGVMGADNFNVLYSSFEVLSDPIKLEHALTSTPREVPLVSLSVAEAFNGF
ncbi:hypothetical protein ACEWPN_00710 [Yoonia sp. R2-816]